MSPPSEPQLPKSGASTRVMSALVLSTDFNPLVRARPIELSAGPPLMIATLPLTRAARNSPSCLPMASLSGPIQLVYSPVANFRSTSTTGFFAALIAFRAAGADSSGPPEMMIASTFLLSRSSTLAASLAASPPASLLMIFTLPLVLACAAMAVSMPLKYGPLSRKFATPIV